MAKSSRSKWKKLHRRQRAQEVASVVEKRVGRLHGKLRLAAEGGLSAVPMEDPETRFHFVNPEMDMNVPQNCKGPNNNFQDILSESLDFNKPLQLRPARTCFHGKSDPNAPHPMTQQFELLDTAAPVAGHALTVKDVEYAPLGRGQERPLRVDHCGNEAEELGTAHNDEEGMEEFVFGCNDAVEETSASAKTLLFPAPGTAAAARQKSNKVAAALEAVPQRIDSMTGSAQRAARAVQVSGTKKAKRLSNIPPTRLARSSGRAAPKKRATTS
ncbi:hypothetical protein TraAM80_06606 [Trypanosoma rangeli]|uniref:Uncharacterized protein n=1 Tax=Trypanosoma rangeli TaxID=5698 RepID=A0A3R7MA57_TRYRA|nr:uncharacterized protein TraAM80_06606 [Trypanosoma rangeli]RNF02193.1 hypothetical protein TraAM80_06606 [Trypanosoma rangeli]|eukprot:RNF02193.1 hypothetical protein TraAM80_06606 [Trypanosoma rangeli]